MKSINIAEINFENSNKSNKEFKFENELQIDSAKTLAYVVRWQLARNRSGSAKTKTMAEISGTTAKPWKQKGTGRARQGSKRSVQFVGGRTCHGPMPRSFDFSIPKKIAKLAIVDALKLKILNNQVIIFKDLTNDIKTNEIAKIFKTNNFKSALIIESDNSKINNAARNIKNIKILNEKALNALDMLNYEHLIINSEIFSTKIIGALK